MNLPHHTPHICGSPRLAEIANVESKIPESFIEPDTGQPTAAFADYAMPLVGPSTTDYSFIDWSELV